MIPWLIVFRNESVTQSQFHAPLFLALGNALYQPEAVEVMMRPRSLMGINLIGLKALQVFRDSFMVRCEYITVYISRQKPLRDRQAFSFKGPFLQPSQVTLLAPGVVPVPAFYWLTISLPFSPVFPSKSSMSLPQACFAPTNPSQSAPPTPKWMWPSLLQARGCGPLPLVATTYFHSTQEPVEGRNHLLQRCIAPWQGLSPKPSAGF